MVSENLVKDERIRAILQAPQLCEIANCRNVICMHGWIIAPKDGPVLCMYCEKTWPDEETYQEERRRAEE